MSEAELPGQRVCQDQGEYRDQIIWPSVRTRKTLQAVAKVDRGDFAPENEREKVYSDEIIPLSDGSSLSQPSLVAEMIDHLDLNGRQRVLEVGTGSGYNAAILSHLASWVDTIECDETLAENAAKRLDRLGYSNVKVYIGDGAQGLPGHGLYDAIIVTAGVREIPFFLEKQLAEGGRIIAPVGEDLNDVQLTVGFKRDGKLITKQVHNVTFHPLVSNYHGGWQSSEQYDEAARAAFYKSDAVFSFERVLDGVAETLNIPRAELYRAANDALTHKALLSKYRVEEANIKYQIPFEAIDKGWACADFSVKETPSQEEV
jgi:protein-L-isoaspartate(D-aspartate) O-methyltransferase